ncbi:NADPH-dependent ferric siderophore reductase [Marinobacterium aestuarii]|uniref:NADPH-dependent ferric siderophore reductase n=1 Tax=Marinobacterium aestuarii TaxID=1821621 RepID=A0A1A9EXX9_9GAMM|nr:siderophore-interacting protein [Marinobacterium aestuarii]ANG62776.1 NADPH-dependent ferric siderophore reductase [Marinobacterium aestuarii]
MTRPLPRELTLLRKAQLTPNMLRVTLGGSAMAEFPADQASAYVKLIFAAQGGARPVMRTYTVRAQREAEIDIDFVIHQDGGPASRWALEAQPGDRIRVGGPGPKKMLDYSADWFLIAGDMTALPAISVNLEQLPRDARGYAVIEIIDQADIQPLAAPDNIDIHWVLNPHPGTRDNVLLDQVQQLPWFEGRPSVWCACEFSSMRRLREHLRARPELDRSNLYISSYWKLGVGEEAHKVLKRADS